MTPLCNNGSLLSLLKQTRNKKYSLLNIQIYKYTNITSCLLLQPFLAIFGRGSDHAFVISSVLCFLDRHSSSNFKVSLQSLYPLSKLLISFILNARSRVNHPLSLYATCVTTTTDLVLSLKLWSPFPFISQNSTSHNCNGVAGLLFQFTASIFGHDQTRSHFSEEV